MKKYKIDKAIKEVLKTLEERPEKNLLNIWKDLETGQKPSYCPLTIGRQVDPEEKNEIPPEDEKEKFAFQILNILKPLKLENPFAPVLSISSEYGTGFMPAGFGVKISSNPDYPGGVEKPLSVEQLEKLKTPEPENEERFQKIKKQIDFYLSNTPDVFKISIPDMQGPFNIAYSITGEEIFYLMRDKPELVHFIMNVVVDYYIKVYKLFQKWIPENRWVPYIGVKKRIAECAVNLVSKSTYIEFIAPYDRKLVNFWNNEVAIHTCSGPHVFEVTLEQLPGVRFTECGIIPKAFAGYLTVEEAIEKLKGKNIILSVGEELQEGKEEETIKHHIDFIKKYPLMTFGYTGMYWKKKDDEFIINLHRKLDKYYYSIN